MLRPISRKYDLKEHAYPVELDTLADLFEGISEAKTISFAGTDAFRDADGPKGNINGANMSALLNALEVSWGTWRCCCRCRARAWATRRSPRWPPRTAGEARQGRVGGDGDHRAGLRLGLGRSEHHRCPRRR